MELHELNIKERAKAVTKAYCDEDTYNHACRVAKYVRENPIIPISIKYLCEAVAYLHDLEEDTDYRCEKDFDSLISEAVKLLTKPKDMNYIEYIKNIKAYAEKDAFIAQMAYWVKMMDIKDHLAQTETLTEKLKEKYIKALPYLL